jgi:uridine phosphorylase
MSKVWPDLSKMPDPNDSSRSQYRAIRCKPEEIAPNVIVPGDPMRAKFIAEEWLTDAKLIMVQREFHTYTGTYKNIPISVISTGIGCPSAAMVIQDLGKINCNYLIRVGTAGSCSAEIKPGDNVIGTGAVRDEGLIEPTKQTLKSKDTPLENLSFLLSYAINISG